MTPTSSLPRDAARPDLTEPDVTGGAQRRYGALSIAIHWTIALLIVVQLCLGWYMNEVLPDHTPAQAQVQSIHVSLGLTILLLVLIRIAVRLTHPAPPLPAGMPAWERLLARATHIFFYLLLLALPLTGWALVSLRAGPIPFWGLTWPHMPGLGALLGSPAPRPVRHELAHIHVFILIWIVLLNLALHVAGALKHQFDGRPVLWRMLPFLKRPGVDAPAARLRP
jgi:cytochrome b561